MVCTNSENVAKFLKGKNADVLQFLNNVRDMAKKCLRRIETFYGLFVDVASASFIIHKPNCIIENNFYLLNLALIFPQ